MSSSKELASFSCYKATIKSALTGTITKIMQVHVKDSNNAGRGKDQAATENDTAGDELRVVQPHLHDFFHAILPVADSIITIQTTALPPPPLPLVMRLVLHSPRSCVSQRRSVIPSKTWQWQARWSAEEFPSSASSIHPGRYRTIRCVSSKPRKRSYSCPHSTQSHGVRLPR